MAEEQDKVMTPDDVAAAQFQIQKIYAKDVSFECPNAPQVFKETGQAEVKMNMAQQVEELGDNLHEVVLTVTVTATVEEQTAYLAEVAQAGIFMLSGFENQAAHLVINTLCPNTLFPYARRAISGMVADGGFPPLTLQPINFEHLYAQRMQEAAMEKSGKKTDGKIVDKGNGEAVAAEPATDD